MLGILCQKSQFIKRKFKKSMEKCSKIWIFAVIMESLNIKIIPTLAQQ